MIHSSGESSVVPLLGDELFALLVQLLLLSIVRRYLSDSSAAVHEQTRFRDALQLLISGDRGGNLSRACRRGGK